MEPDLQAHYIKADSGYSVVEAIFDADSGKMQPVVTPIIAWLIQHETTGEKGNERNITAVLVPVTVEGIDNTNPIVYPDGRVHVPFEGIYDSVSVWMRNQEAKQQNPKTLGAL